MHHGKKHVIGMRKGLYNLRLSIKTENCLCYLVTQILLLLHSMKGSPNNNLSPWVSKLMWYTINLDNVFLVHTVVLASNKVVFMIPYTIFLSSAYHKFEIFTCPQNPSLSPSVNDSHMTMHTFREIQTVWAGRMNSICLGELG